MNGFKIISLYTILSDAVHLMFQSFLSQFYPNLVFKSFSGYNLKNI